MELPVSARARRVLLVGCLAFFGLQSVANLLNGDSSAWFWVGGYAVASFFLLGPLAWLARNWIPADRRESLTYLVLGSLFVCFFLVLGVELALGGVLFLFDAFIVGCLVGSSVALLAELTIVPERLRTGERGRS